MLEYFHIRANNIRKHNKKVEEKVRIMIIILRYNSYFAVRSRHRYCEGNYKRPNMYPVLTVGNVLLGEMLVQ